MKSYFWPALLLLAGPLGAFSFDLRDSEGRRHTFAEAQNSKAIVLLFLATDCPISNRYAPDLGRLFSEYSARGVRFYGVHSDPSVDQDEVRRHAREFRFPFPLLIDPAQSLARQIGATTTPEAAVISQEGELQYRGRIDDRVVDFGKQRSSPTRLDLRLALDESLAGRPVSRPVTKAIGCGIPFVKDGQARMPIVPTFSRDIASILYKNCVSCHRQGEVVPFPLVSYQDAAKRAALIAEVTARRYMPPWKPEPCYGSFQGERGLTEAEIRLIREWAGGGAPEGDPAQLPAAPRFTAGWQLGTPDQVVKMPEPFSIAADGPDVYQCFAIPLGLSEDKHIKAIEFRPENRKVVHHALFFADPSRIGREKDAADPEVGYRCFGGPGYLPARGLGGWSPGARPVTMPEGAALTLPKGADLVLQLHFHATGKPEKEQSILGLYFTQKPPEKKIIDIGLGSRHIDIAPGEKEYKVKDSFTVPIEVQAIGIIPHAHYICRDMKGRAILPDGTMQWLIWIRDWDFNWQEQYQYAEPVRLPAGTRLEMEFTYDNSDQNPRNPSHPPRRVVWGADVTDEMAGLHIQIIPDDMSELPELTTALWGKFMRSVGGGFFRTP